MFGAASMSITSNKPIAQPSSIPIDSPWMEPTAFPVPPMPATYGYQHDKASHTCSKDTLIDEIQRDTNKKIALVWTPDSTHLTPPEEIPWLFDAVRARERAHLKQARFFAVINTVSWGIIAVLSFSSPGSLSQFPIFAWIALGVLPLIEHTWSLYRLRNHAPTLMAAHIPEARYMAWLGHASAPWTWFLVGCLTLVGGVQLLFGLWFFVSPGHSSIAAAGIVKPAIRAGEWWRLLTGTFLHANLLHFFFNIAALFGLGKILEVTFHRAYVPLIFVLSALSGSLWSLILLPNTTSVGASGGIMGLLGFVLVVAWRQRQRFPHSLRRSLLNSLLYIALAGLLAYQVIDNPAHAGGLVTGATLGILRVRAHEVHIPDHVSPLLYAGSMMANGFILATTVVCLYLTFGA
jgi:membrane associated rhomboid family serine protease